MPKNITFFKKDGDIFPKRSSRKMEEKLKNHLARRRRIKSKMTFFSSPEENIDNEKIIKQTKIANDQAGVPIKPQKETLNYDKKKPTAKTKIAEADLSIQKHHNKKNLSLFQLLN